MKVSMLSLPHFWCQNCRSELFFSEFVLTIKTSVIKCFHLADAGSYTLGCIPEFHSVHFLILKQNILTSRATCSFQCIFNCFQISFPHTDQALSILLQVSCSVRTGSTTLPFLQVRGIPRKMKIWLTSSYHSPH